MRRIRCAKPGQYRGVGSERIMWETKLAKNRTRASGKDFDVGVAGDVGIARKSLGHPVRFSKQLPFRGPCEVAAGACNQLATIQRPRPAMSGLRRNMQEQKDQRNSSPAHLGSKVWDDGLKNFGIYLLLDFDSTWKPLFSNFCTSSQTSFARPAARRPWRRLKVPCWQFCEGGGWWCVGNAF